jgi:hypothetical protein
MLSEELNSEWFTGSRDSYKEFQFPYYSLLSLIALLDSTGINISDDYFLTDWSIHLTPLYQIHITYLLHGVGYSYQKLIVT